jgi:hypothetical protein
LPDCPPEENTREEMDPPKDIHAIIQAMTKEERAEFMTLQVAEGIVKFKTKRGQEEKHLPLNLFILLPYSLSEFLLAIMAMDSRGNLKKSATQVTSHSPNLNIA